MTEHTHAWVPVPNSPPYYRCACGTYGRRRTYRYDKLAGQIVPIPGQPIRVDQYAERQIDDRNNHDRDRVRTILDGDDDRNEPFLIRRAYDRTEDVDG